MDKKNIYCVIAGIVLALLAIGLFSWYTGSGGRGNDSSTEVAIDNATKQNAGAGAAVNDSIRELDGIREGVAATESQLRESAASADRIAAKNHDSRQLIERCLELNRETKQLIEDIERTNQAGPPQSENK
ncbi:MAG: hypothetical protein AB9883_07720 [Acidaminococcaceae bacterium]